MATHTKIQWTDAEIAFIIGYADYCIDYNIDYAATVVNELRKRSPRPATWSTIQCKLKRTFTSSLGFKLSVKEFINQGTDYLAIPPNISRELIELHREWDMLPSAVEDTPEPIRDNETISSTADPATLQNNDNRSDTILVDDPMESHSNTIPGIDGPSDQHPMRKMSTPSPITPTKSAPVPSPITPIKSAPRRKRTVTPEDANDLEYEPSPKRIKPSEQISKRSTTNALKGPKGIAQVKGVAVPTKRAPKRQNTAAARRSPSVIVIDEATGLHPSVTVSSQTSEKTSGENKRKREAEVASEAADTALGALSKRQKLSVPTIETVNEKVDALMSVLSGILNNSEQNMQENVLEHLQQIIRTAERPQTSLVGDLIKDLKSQRNMKEDYRVLIRKLVDFRNLTSPNVFPKEPHQKDVSRSWSEFHEQMVSIVGPNNVTPMLTPASAAYIASAAEQIADSRITDDQLQVYIESLQRYLKSPHAQQAVFSALFCRWVFSNPEPMLDDMHSEGMLHLYEGVLKSASNTADGLDRMQEYDKVAANSLFKSPAFENIQTTRRVSELKSQLQAMRDRLCKKSNIPLSKSPNTFAKEVVELKQQLLLSPKQYRIHYVRPGMLFDPSWMQAYAPSNDPISDEAAAGRKVLLCSFPALTCENEKAVKDDAKVDEVLVKNKRFLPTFQEIIDFKPDMQLKKAVVLLHAEQNKER
ncbi:hypothetical protein OPT61_g2703 [Boeremia exigua]|uniref:Uncharacterized protein n=1 Tax=Boeremia exigua TaxID=749465 RepID=A0ACC2IKT7_9PLEO|nr:hypothetical protein OPT61_g2703 [Boeremia exigua]